MRSESLSDLDSSDVLNSGSADKGLEDECISPKMPYFWRSFRLFHMRIIADPLQTNCAL